MLTSPVQSVHSRRRRTAARCIISAAVAGLLPAVTSAADRFWDINGASNGASGSPTAGGTWSQGASVWSPSSTGNVSTGIWLNDGSATAVFAAGFNATGIYSVTIGASSALAFNGMRFEEGTVTLIPSGTSTLTLAGAGLDVAIGATATIAHALGGATGVIKNGPGILTLGAANNYTGGTTVSAGFLNVSADTNLGNSSGTVALAGGTLAATNSFNSARGFSIGSTANSGIDVAPSQILTLAGVISGGGGGRSLVKTGSGTLVVTGASNYSNNGALSVQAGTLKLGATNALPTNSQLNGSFSGTFDLAGFNQTLHIFGPGVVTNSSGTASTLTSNNTSSGHGYNGTLTGNLAYVQNGTGTISFGGTAANTYTGGTTVNGGALELGKTAGNAVGGSIAVNNSATLRLLASNQIPDSAVVTLNSSATFNLNGSSETFAGLGGSSSSAVVTNSSPTASTLTLAVPTAGDILYGGTISGNLSLVVNNGYATQTFNQPLTYTGTTTINNAGGIYTNGTNILPTTGAVIINSGAGLNLGGNAQTVGTVSGAGDIQLSSGTLTTSFANANATFSGHIEGVVGSVIKAGSGTFTVSGAVANTHAGLTSVNGGVMQLGKSNNINAVGGNVTVNNSGTLFWLANEQIPDTATLTLNSGGTLNLNGKAETVGSFIDNGGATVTGGGSGGIYISSGDLSLTDNTVIATNVGLAGNVNYTGSISAATISGNLTLTSALAQHTFTINNAAAATDTLVSGNISGTGIDKTGLGALKLTGANSVVDSVTVNQGQLDIAGGLTISSGALTVGGTDPGTLSISGSGVLTATGGNDAVLGLNGAAIVNQSGGTASFTNVLKMGANLGASATYNLSGGKLLVAGEIIGLGGAGAFTQSGGTHSVTGGASLVVGSLAGSAGIYTLNGGVLDVSGPAHIGYTGNGTFTQSGGSATFNTGLTLGTNNGGTGYYNQSGGSVTVIGGRVRLGSVAGSSGSYTLSGTGSLNTTSMDVGYSGPGTFVQTGGTHTVTSDLVLANSLAPGLYTLSGGTLNAGLEAIGGGPVWTNDATFVQSGGTNTAGTLTLGGSGGSSGIYQLSGGSLVVTGNASIGVSSQTNALANSFTQTGGTASIGGNLALGTVSPSAGSFNISAGAASAGNIYVGGSSTTPAGNATLSISGSASVSTLGVFKIWNVSSTQFHLNGGSLTVGTLDTQNFNGHFNWTGGTLTHLSALTIEAGEDLGGNVTIGAGKVLNTSDFFIASNAAATFAISGGGVVNSTTPAGIVQLGGNNTATATISGAGSAWNVTATEFRVGDFGSASLALTSGAALNVTGDIAVARTGLSSTLSVSGSTLAATGSVYVGGSALAAGGVGSFIVTAGSIANIGGTVKVWNGNSSLTVGANSTVNANAFDFASNTNSVAAGALLNVGAGGAILRGSSGSRVIVDLAGDAANPARFVLAGDLSLNGTIGTASITSSPTGGQLRGILDLAGGSRNFDVTNGPNLNDLIVSARITNGAITKSGLGSFLISAPADYTGPTNVNAGSIILGVANALPATTDLAIAAGASFNMAGFSQTLGSLAGGGNVALGASATTTLTVGGSGSPTIFAGPISGSGSFVKDGTGLMTASGSLGFTGSLTVNNGILELSPGNTFGGAGQSINLTGTGPTFGTLAVGADSAMGSSSNSISFTGGHLQITSTFGTNRPITLGLGNGTIDVLSGVTFSPSFAMSGTGGLNKIGAGTLSLVANATFSGNTTLLEGTIRASGASSDRLPAATILTMATGTTLDLNNNAQSIATLIGDGTIALGGATFTTGSGDSWTAFAGSINGTGTVVKNGLGTLYLTGNSSFTNFLTVNAGEVALSGSANTFGGDISIAGSGAVSANSEAALGNAANIVKIGGIFSATGTYTTGHPIQIGNSFPTIDVAQDQIFTLAANLFGSAGVGSGLHKTGAGSFNVTTDTSMTPQILYVDAGVFSLSGNGAVTGVSSNVTILTGGTLALDNTVTNNNNRILNTTQLGLNGGTFRFLGTNGVNSSESVGALSHSPGASTVAIYEGAGGTSTVTFSSLSNSVFPHATLNFVANGLGATDKVIFTGKTAGFMGARYTINDTDFADYDATNGVTLAATTGSFTSNAHVLLNANTTAPAATISTLSLDATSNPVNVTQSGALDLDGILKFGSQTASISGSTLANNSSNYLYIHASGADLTINSALKNGSPGNMSLVKSGAGTVILTSTDTTNHNILGGFYLNDGTIQVSSDANLGASLANGSDLNFLGGTLATTASFALSNQRTLTFNPNGGGINVVASGTTLTAATSNQLVGATTTSWFNKTGAGTFVISNTNQNFKGPVNVQAGTLELQNTGALGGTGPTWSTITLQPASSLTLKSDGPYPANFHSDIVVKDNTSLTPATINTDRFTAGTGGAYQLGGLKIGNSTLVNAGGAGRLQFTNTVILNGNATFSNSRDLILTGQVTGTGTLTKTGIANMVLGADPNDLSAAPDTKHNTYVGLTTIANGTLYLNKQPGINAITGNIEMAGGNLILLQPKQIADTSLLTLTGGQFDVNGQNDAVKNIDAKGTAQVKVAGGGSLTVKDTKVSENATLTISTPASGSFTGGENFGSGSSLQSIDSGTYYTDSLDVSDGTVLVNPGGVLSIGTALHFKGSASPAITLVSNSNTPGKTLLGGNVDFSQGTGTAQFNNSGSPPIAGTVDLGGFSRTFTVFDAGTTLALTNVRLTNGGIRAQGAGTLRLTADSDLTGGISLAGVLEVTSPQAMGTGPVSLSNNPTLRLLSDSPTTTYGNDISTTGGSATLFVGPNTGPTTGTARLGRLTTGAGEITVTGAATGKLEFAGNVALTGAPTFTNFPTLEFSGAISGTFGITKSSTGSGVMRFSGAAANTYTGNTVVQGGVLELAKSAGVDAVAGNINAQNATVRWINSDQVKDTATLTTVTPNSTFDLLNKNETITNVVTAGGTFTGTGILSVLGNVTANPNAFTAQIAGNLSLPTLGVGPSHTFTVTNNTTNGTTTTLSVSAALQGLGPITKAGAGTLILSGNNAAYRGNLTVAAGTLGLGASSAVGANDLILAGGTVSTTTTAITTTRGISVSSSGSFSTPVFSATVGSISGSSVATFTKVGAGSLTSSALAVGNVAVNTGTLRVAPRSSTGNNSVARLVTLSVAPNATFDLNDNDLVLNSGNFATVQSLVFEGYRASADPAATGIVSSAAQAAGGATILALFENSLVGFVDWPSGSGKTITPAAIVGKYTYIGDTNMDGQVSAQDYTAIDANIGTSQPLGISWFYGDTNFDGNIDATDYTGIDAALGLGQGLPLAAAGLSIASPIDQPAGLLHVNGLELATGDASFGSSAIASVPEPGGASLILMGTSALLCRRRKTVTRR